MVLMDRITPLPYCWGKRRSIRRSRRDKDKDARRST